MCVCVYLVGLGLSVLRVVLLVGLGLCVLLHLALGLLVLLLVVHYLLFLQGGGGGAQNMSVLKVPKKIIFPHGRD